MLQDQSCLAQAIDSALAVLRAMSVAQAPCDSSVGIEVHAPRAGDLVGRVLAAPVALAGLELPANAVLTEDEARRVAARAPSVRLRSPITCEAESPPCCACLGWLPRTRQLAEPGGAAGQALAEQLLRAWGPAVEQDLRELSRPLRSRARARVPLVATARGVLRSKGGFFMRDGERICAGTRPSHAWLVNREARGDRILDEWSLEGGDTLLFPDGTLLEAGEEFGRLRRFGVLRAAEVAGTTRVSDLHLGVNAERRVLAGFGAQVVVMDTGGAVPAPRVGIEGQAELGRPCSDGDIVFVGDGEPVVPGHPLSWTPRAPVETWGRTRSAHLLCAVPPADEVEVRAEVAGRAELARTCGGGWTIMIRGTSPERQQVVELADGRAPAILHGESLRAGDVIVTGAPDPRTLSAVLGSVAAATHLLELLNEEESQHRDVVPSALFEVLLQRTHDWVEVTHPGASRLRAGQVLSCAELKTLWHAPVDEPDAMPLGHPVMIGIDAVARRLSER